ncbi:MAG: pyridoxamine 5'-phosphate oxidase [Vicinamibacteria bacterium]|nr:pyridoxamine 5'-phosphate oxidase [Vicinamibacteria bacterium]
MNDPVSRFLRLYARASKEESSDHTVAALATASDSGHPAVRMVLLKNVSERGFVFYTNYSSRKARDLAVNPRAALCFHWPRLAVQVRVEGQAERVSDEESDAYFASRPRLSRLAAWASLQSAPLPGRHWLLARFLRFSLRYAGRSVPRPPFWGGYRVVPQKVEFWYNQPHRLHDRILYLREDEGWRSQRLFP